MEYDHTKIKIGTFTFYILGTLENGGTTYVMEKDSLSTIINTKSIRMLKHLDTMVTSSMVNFTEMVSIHEKTEHKRKDYIRTGNDVESTNFTIRNTIL
jgi:hypothetical protein